MLVVNGYKYKQCNIFPKDSFGMCASIVIVQCKYVMDTVGFIATAVKLFQTKTLGVDLFCVRQLL